MPGMGDFLKTAVHEHFLRNNSQTSPTTVYLALNTTAPGDDDSGTECSGTAYARAAIAFGAETGGVGSNSGLVTMATVGAGGWGTATHWKLMDALTVGDLMLWGALDNSHVLAENDVPKVQIGGLTVTWD